MDARTVSSLASVRCRVIAPIASVSPSSVTWASSAMRVQVDQHRRRGEAQVHQRHEALPAGERLGVVAVLGQQRDALVEGRRVVVGEPVRLHRVDTAFRRDQLRATHQLAVAAGDHAGRPVARPLVEPAARLHAEIAAADPVGERRLRRRRAVEVGQQVGVDGRDHVEARDVGRLERADRRKAHAEAGAHGQVDVGGRRHAGVQQRDRLAHDGLLHARAEEPEHLVVQHDGHLADRPDEVGGLRHPVGGGVLAAGDLDDRHQVRGVPEVQRHDPLAVAQRCGDIGHPQARGVGGDAARPARSRPRRPRAPRASSRGPRTTASTTTSAPARRARSAAPSMRASTSSAECGEALLVEQPRHRGGGLRARQRRDPASSPQSTTG